MDGRGYNSAAMREFQRNEKISSSIASAVVGQALTGRAGIPGLRDDR
jgi:hypothetical protein